MPQALLSVQSGHGVCLFSTRRFLLRGVFSFVLFRALPQMGFCIQILVSLKPFEYATSAPCVALLVEVWIRPTMCWDLRSMHNCIYFTLDHVKLSRHSISRFPTIVSILLRSNSNDQESYCRSKEARQAYNSRFHYCCCTSTVCKLYRAVGLKLAKEGATKI